MVRSDGDGSIRMELAASRNLAPPSGVNCLIRSIDRPPYDYTEPSPLLLYDDSYNAINQSRFTHIIRVLLLASYAQGCANGGDKESSSVDFVSVIRRHSIDYGWLDDALLRKLREANFATSLLEKSSRHKKIFSFCILSFNLQTGGSDPPLPFGFLNFWIARGYLVLFVFLSSSSY